MIARDAGSALGSMMVMTLVLSILTFLFLAKGAADFLVVSLESRVDVSAYFVKDTAEEDILNLREQLSDLSEVRDVQYVSQDEALTEFRDMHKDDRIILDSLDALGQNPLLASLRIRTWESASYEKIAGILEQGPSSSLIQKVDWKDRAPVIERLKTVTSGIQRFGMLLAVALGGTAVLVAFNTVRASISSTKREIEVMRLVGASNWFIRGPFLVQGALVGIVAAVCSFLIFLAGSFFFDKPLSLLMPGFSILGYFLGHWIVLLGLEAGIGIILGGMSSLIAMRRYLRT